MAQPLESEYVVQLVCERFAPFTKIAGPLLAGSVSVDQTQGNLYLTELKTWLWLGPGADDIRTLTNSETDSITTPQNLVRQLLDSMTHTITALQERLERMEAKSNDAVSLLGYYLGDSVATVVDAIALRHTMIRSSDNGLHGEGAPPFPNCNRRYTRRFPLPIPAGPVPAPQRPALLRPASPI